MLQARLASVPPAQPSGIHQRNLAGSLWPPTASLLTSHATQVSLTHMPWPRREDKHGTLPWVPSMSRPLEAGKAIFVFWGAGFRYSVGSGSPPPHHGPLTGAMATPETPSLLASLSSPENEDTRMWAQKADCHWGPHPAPQDPRLASLAQMSLPALWFWADPGTATG